MIKKWGGLSRTDVFILCGGRGTRLGKITQKIPKPLVHVKGRPFLDLVLDDLVAQGVRRVTFGLGYMAHSIRSRYEEGRPGLEKIYFSTEKIPLGTGGALRLARKYLKSDPFIVINGDTFMRADLTDIVEAHQRHRALVTLVACRVPDASDFGTIRIEPTGRFREFIEKCPGAKAGWVNAGIYVFSGRIWSRMPRGRVFSLEKDLLARLEARLVYAHRVRSNFFDIGTPERLTQARHDL
jgi:NDP-sugar pyrophosphorylase family protein